MRKRPSLPSLFLNVAYETFYAALALTLIVILAPFDFRIEK